MSLRNRTIIYADKSARRWIGRRFEELTRDMFLLNGGPVGFNLKILSHSGVK